MAGRKKLTVAPRTRGAKSGGTGEPGSQKVYWPAESFGTPEEKASL